MSGPMPRRAARRPRRWAASLTVTALTLLGLLGTSAPAAAASGPDGQQVTVSKSTLDPAGDTVTVSGSGFDTAKGIYVALCVDNGAGRQPSPCLGGVDMEGAGGSSAWISSNPPAYGEGLAVPFTESGGRGSFAVTLTLAASDAFTDCLDPAVAPDGCVLGTRADHTRAGDRSADVRIPVTFATAGSAAPGGAGGSSDAAPDAGSAGTAEDGSLASTGAAVGIAAAAAALLVAAGTAVVVLRRRSTDATGV